MVLEERKAQNEEKKFEQMQNVTKRRLNLDEKCFELEKSSASSRSLRERK